MKIACISNLDKPTNLEVRSGQEVWLARFIGEEVKRGQTFDLYATPGSIEIKNKVNLIPITEKPLEELKKTNQFFSNLNEKDQRYYFSSIYLKTILLITKKKYDLIIDSSNYPPLPPIAGLINSLYLVVVHTPIVRKYVSFFEYFPYPNNLYYIFPTGNIMDKATIIPNNKKFHIPHGVDNSQFPFSLGQHDQVLWLGRIDPRVPKGIVEALQVAAKTNRRFIFNTSFIEDQNYFVSKVKKLFGKNSKFHLNKPRKELFAQAKVFLYPLQEEDMFPQTIIESMSAGIPVISFARNAALETIRDGETGFLVNPSDKEINGEWEVKKTGIAGLLEAVKKIYSLPSDEYERMRLNCRKRVEEYFTVEKMVDGYEKVYKKIIKGRKQHK